MSLAAWVAAVAVAAGLSAGAEDKVVRDVASVVGVGLWLTWLVLVLGQIAGCSPSEPYGHAAVELAEVLGG